jgi:membrane protease YdiL (CAAX protease family)
MPQKTPKTSPKKNAIKAEAQLKARTVDAPRVTKKLRDNTETIYRPFSDDLSANHPFSSIKTLLIAVLSYIFIIVTLGVLISFLAVFLEISPTELRDYSLYSFFILSVQSALTIGVLAIVLKLGKRNLRSLGFKRPQLKLIVDIFIVFGFYFVSYLLLRSVIISLFPAFEANQEQDLGFSNISNAQKIYVGIGLVIIVPIAEEMFFRGFLYRGLRKNFSIVWAAVITSALFGLVHGQWNVAIDVFVLSIALIYLYESTNNIWAPIALHMLKNGLAFAALYLIK